MRFVLLEVLLSKDCCHTIITNKILDSQWIGKFGKFGSQFSSNSKLKNRHYTLINIIKHFILVSNVLLVIFRAFCECLQEKKKKIKNDNIQRDEEGRDRRIGYTHALKEVSSRAITSSITHVKLEGRGTQKIKRLAHATKIRMGPRFALRGQHPRASVRVQRVNTLDQQTRRPSQQQERHRRSSPHVYWSTSWYSTGGTMRREASEWSSSTEHRERRVR